VGDRSRSRFATPAESPLRGCSPYSHLHIRRDRLGFVHRSRAIFYHPVPNPSVTIASFLHRCTAVGRRGDTPGTSPRLNSRCGLASCEAAGRQGRVPYNVGAQLVGAFVVGAPVGAVGVCNVGAHVASSPVARRNRQPCVPSARARARERERERERERRQ
jgi:hypothetical protein